jgi:hypothetical protein
VLGSEGKGMIGRMKRSTHTKLTVFPVFFVCFLEETDVVVGPFWLPAEVSSAPLPPPSIGRDVSTGYNHR